MPSTRTRFRHDAGRGGALRLRADVPVGCYLSGGLDSCAVLGLAARHRSDPIRAFTLTFDRADYDESAIAREMAERVGAEFHPIPIRQADLADHFADAVCHTETLCINAHGVAKYLLSRAVRDAGYKVVSPARAPTRSSPATRTSAATCCCTTTTARIRPTVARLLDELNDANPVSRGLLLPDGQALPLGERAPAPRASCRRGSRPSAPRRSSCARSSPTTSSPRSREEDPYRALLNGLDVRGQLHGRAPVNQSLYLWSKTQLPNYILTILGDRMEMAHSVEGRVPFLDHQVVELVRSLPVTQKIRGMTEKYVLREATRSVLTDTVYRRQKHPFTSPPVALTPEQRLHELLQDTLRGRGHAIAAVLRSAQGGGTARLRCRRWTTVPAPRSIRR